MLSQILVPEKKNSTFVENELMIKAVVFSESAVVCQSVTNTVETYCPNVNLLACNESVKAGVASINEHEPDLVIIDTKLSDGSGFDLVRHFNKPDFKIIFLSLSPDYAITAIKFNTVDYLLKPIDNEELTLAINKVVDMIHTEENLQQQALGESIRQLNSSQRLVLKTSDQMHVVNVSDIIRIEADSNYSTFHLMGGKKILVSKALKEYEDLLLEHGFHRIHKSHIFNIHKISYLDKSDGGFVIMIDGSRVPVASRKRDKLLELFDEMK